MAGPVTSKVGALVTRSGARQENNYSDDGQRRDLQTRKGRLEWEGLRCWAGNKGTDMNSYFKIHT